MTLFRYVFLEIAKTFLLAFAGLSALIFVAFMLNHLHQVQGASLDFLLALFPNLLPEVLLITLPASLLLGVVFTLGRLASDSELNAMRANGVHLGRLMVPGLLLGLVLSVVSAWVIHVLIPRAHYARRSLIGKALQGLTTAMGSGVRDIRLGDHYIRFKEFKDGKLIEADIFLVDAKGNRESIRAREAILTLDEENSRLVLELRDAMVTFQTGSKSRDIQSDAIFGELKRDIDLSKRMKKGKSLSDLSDSEISARLAASEAGRWGLTSLRTEWHVRKAMSVAPLMFAIAGAPLAMLLRRGGRVAGLAAVVIPVLAVYYPLSMAGEALGSDGRLPAALAAWAANAVLGAAGLVVFKRWVQL